jgi:hypothetical protein
MIGFSSVRASALMGHSILLLATLSWPANADESTGVGAALRTIFSPHRAPASRTMGLAQRTFLDLVEESRPRLEVAFVIDGTDSMEIALQDVQAALNPLMSDLDLYKRSDVRYQLVVYRDEGSTSGVVSFPLESSERGFIGDRDQITAALGNLKPESGAPYFPEQVDTGVHQALTELKWSTDDQTSRWVFLIGDAPPFDVSSTDSNTVGRRQYATDALVALAASKQISINCILCASREADQPAYQSVLDRTRAFMNSLSSGTNGLMLDLSYDDIRSSMLAADDEVEVRYTPVGSISADDVAQARGQFLEPASPSDASLTLAILPHAPLAEMTFASTAPAVRLATELRLRLKSVPGLTISDPLVVERRFQQLQRNRTYAGLRGDALLQLLARAIGADYILWGEIGENSGSRRVTTRMYAAGTGKIVAQTERSSTTDVAPAELGGLLAGDMLAASIPTNDHPALAHHLTLASTTANSRDAVIRPIASSAAQDDLLSGLAALDKALSFPVGDAASAPLLDEAQQHLSRAAELDNDNALPHFLLASCHFNQAALATKENTDATQLAKESGQQLRMAYRLRNQLGSRELQREIEADYALLVRKQPGEAIPLYAALANSSFTSDTARRANWMLAGIYGGDWGVDPQFVDQAQAREHLIRLLAIWPDSAESQFIRRVLRWDDRAGETQFEYLPKSNERTATAVDREA